MREKRSSGRDAAAILGGLALGVVGSRLLRPIFAMATGKLRSCYGEGPFERLKRDHRMIMGTLDKMVHVSDSSAVVRMPLLLTLKRTLAKHALAEEDVVYPLLHDRAAAEEQSKHLYAEHAEMKIHLHNLETAVAEGTNWSDPVQTLRDLIGKHIREEEDVEFPRLRAALNAQDTASLSGQIHREEAMVL